MDAFVHASGDGFGNTAPLRSDTGAIDMDAISQVAHVTQGAGKLTRKEKKHAKREMKRRKKEAKKAEKEAKKTYSSIKSQLKDRDKELSDKMADARKKRDSAKDVVNYIGYNKMYQDGICEVEEGMFSSSIAFDDTSYHSVRDEQQKAMFSAITRLYDQFGADTLVQMSVINTPLLKEEVGHRKFFDPERQANDAARNDAQVFNNILNDKVKEGVSNIRRNRYLTYSVTADTAEDAARQLSRIEVESSRILNSIGSKAHLMNGTQRLSVIHSLLNPYKPFLFDYQRDISAKRFSVCSRCAVSYRQSSTVYRRSCIVSTEDTLTVPSSPRWHRTFLTATPNPRFSTDFLSAAKHAANPVRNRAFRPSPVSTKSMSASTSRS